MEIDGKKRKEIREALIEAFPMPNQLRLVTDDILGEPLQNITSLNNDLLTMAFDLITWAKSRGRLTELVIGAAAANPGGPKLKVLAEHFQFAAAVPGEVERIVLQDVPFENVGQWLDKMTRYRRAICRIEPQPPPDIGGYGTGFLVAPDVVMTNHHVVAPFLNHGADQVVLRFDYEVDLDGVTVRKGRESKLADDWKMLVSPEGELDFALIRLTEAAGDDSVAGGKRGFLKPVAHQFKRDRPLIILQHPAALPLKLAMGSVVDPDSYPNRVAYNVNTEGGSSGSPCFTSALNLVAIHHWGGANHNRGVRHGPILEFLKTHRAELENKNLTGLVT